MNENNDDFRQFSKHRLQESKVAIGIVSSQFDQDAFHIQAMIKLRNVRKRSLQNKL